MRTITVIEAKRDHAVVLKPAGLPSVPPRAALDDPAAARSVQTLVPELLDAHGPIVVHRLDSETSGLMVVALTRRAHRTLSRQFMQRKVGKSYVAVLDGRLERDEGAVDLPLRVDWPNRPRQRVDLADGKPARTLYRVLEREGARTRVAFRPLTGRTHQLRVHAATPACVDACLADTDDFDDKTHRCGWPNRGGLGAPIAGDTLYGHPDSAPRLLLHADSIAFFEPATGEWRTYRNAPPF